MNRVVLDASHVPKTRGRAFSADSSTLCTSMLEREFKPTQKGKLSLSVHGNHHDFGVAQNETTRANHSL